MGIKGTATVGIEWWGCALSGCWFQVSSFRLQVGEKVSSFRLQVERVEKVEE